MTRPYNHQKTTRTPEGKPVEPVQAPEPRPLFTCKPYRHVFGGPGLDAVCTICGTERRTAIRQVSGRLAYQLTEDLIDGEFGKYDKP